MSPFRASAAFTESWEHFRFELADGVATVVFDRPDRLNALTFEVYADLRDLLGEIEHRGDVSVLVITGEGRGFCSGGDVEEIIGDLQRSGTKRLLEFARLTGSVVEGMRRVPVPVIAAVNGVAAGAGSVIALAADLRILARSATFHFLFTKVGLAGADACGGKGMHHGKLNQIIGTTFGQAVERGTGQVERSGGSRPVALLLLEPAEFQPVGVEIGVGG